MTPVLIAVAIGTGLLALLPTRRLAVRSEDRWLLTAYFLVLWILLAATILVPPLRRAALPVVLLVAVAPWVDIRAGIDRLLGRSRTVRRPPPRNVTPPDAGPRSTR